MFNPCNCPVWFCSFCEFPLEPAKGKTVSKELLKIYLILKELLIPTRNHEEIFYFKVIPVKTP